MTISPTQLKKLFRFPFLLGESTWKPTWSTQWTPWHSLLPPWQFLLPQRQSLLTLRQSPMYQALLPRPTSLLQRVQAVYLALQTDWTYKSAARGEGNEEENP